jgi:hypothetical protein
MKVRLPAMLLACLVAQLLPPARAGAPEDIGFVSEHLPEIAMDNRYAQLPLWSSCATEDGYCPSLNVGYAATRSQTLSIEGPMFSVGLTHEAGRWSMTGFAFYDPLRLRSASEQRPLDVDFAAGVPYRLPAPAEFSGLDGSAHDIGFGIALRRDAALPWLGHFAWTAGVSWQQMSLRDYRYDYRILTGPDAGSAGQIGYDADYRHVVPFAGMSWPGRGERWAYAPHFQVAIPLPRRGMDGRITGPGFDLAGNQAEVGAGKHFGDPSVTIGFDVTYLPWNLSVDLGTAVSQYLLEPRIHEGVDRDLLLTVRWDGWSVD